MTRAERRRDAGQQAWRASAGSADTYRVDRVIDAVTEANPWVSVVLFGLMLAFAGFMAWLLLR